MSENPREKKDGAKREAEKVENDMDSTQSADKRRRRDYYYDDAHGYEVYNPADDEDKEENL